MMEVFFVIGALFIIGAVVKGLSGSSSTPPIDVNPRAFQSSNSVPIPIGSFQAKQYIGDNEHSFNCSLEYNESDNTMIVLIDGRKLGIKMKLDKTGRNSFIEILNKAIEWNIKALEANLTAEKLISYIYADVSFVVGHEVYYSKNSEIEFDFYNNPIDSEGSAIMVASSKYDIGGVWAEPSVIFINNNQFVEIKSLLSEENIQSVLNELAEKSRIQDEILT